MNLKNKTTAELVTIRNQITAAPENQMPKGSLWLYTVEARRKLDKIDWAITHNLSDARRQTGDPVPADGYSGRQNKRRH